MVAGLCSQRGASYKLLSMLNDSRWQLNISTTLVFESEEILNRERVQLGLSPKDINNLLDGICAISNKCSIFYLWRPVASDPDDDFLVDLAVEAQADFMTKDYLEQRSERGSWQKFRAVLTKVPDVQPEDYDKL